jgi:NEDD4-binding protein 2
MEKTNPRNENYKVLKPTLFIVRGIPGSGKSTFANHVWNEYAICEADKFFYDKDGNYNFDVSRLREAHEWCRKEVETRMQDNKANPQFYPEIVVSNTSTQEWEMRAYFDLAERYGYQVVSLIVENRHGGKNTHNVPDEVLENMRKRFEIKL